MTSERITRYVRYTQAGVTSYAVLEGETIRRLQGDLFENPRPTGETVALSAVTLEVPIDPQRVQKVIGVASNFPMPARPPREVLQPRLFAKFACNLVPSGAEVEMPPECEHLHHEGELVVVIGKAGRSIPLADVRSHIFGVSVGNDVSDENWYGERQGVEEPSRLISKACDTWSPLGPAIAAGLDYGDLNIQVRLDGEVVSEGRTSEMICSVDKVVSYLSAYLTLVPGDLIYMGCPPWTPGKREMQVGQTIEVEIEKVGLLRNRIVPMKGGLSLPAP